MSITSPNDADLRKQQKNTLIQLWTSLKNSIFDVLFVVLDRTTSEGQEISLMSIVYQSGIDYIQMMQFPFNFTIILVWNGGETLNNIFNFLTSVLQINNLMPSLNYNAFLACLYLLIFMIILVIVDIVYVSYSFTKKKFRFTLPLVLLARVVPLFVTFLFIPIMEFLLNIVSCNPSQQDPNVTVLQYFPTVQCFSGAHIVHVSITLFFTSIFVFISTVVAMTLFQPRISSNNIMARKTSKGQVIFILNKVICQFFFSFTPFTQTWIYIALMFFPALWLFCFYQFQNPFYNKNVGKLYRIFSFYFFWTVLMLSISQVLILLGFNFEGAMVIWFCGLPFIGFNIGYESRSNIDNLFSSNMKFKTGEELQEHLQYVLQLINDRKKDENSNMLLVGYIEKHIETCVEDDCPIKIKKPKKEEILSQMDENCKLLTIQLERMYKQGIKKFPLSTKLHISFAFFYMEELKQKAKAYEEFIRAERASPSFIEEFIIYRFKKIIKEKLEESKEEESDLIEIIRFDNHVSLCQEAMVHSAKLHKEFWTELIEEMPNLQKLNETGSKIISIVNTVRLNYTEVNKINSHSPQIIHNYGLYSMFISQNISAGKKCLNQSKRAYYQKKAKGELILAKNQTLEIDSNYSLVVSASQASMGKILTVNDSFIEMTGYLKQEITQKSIDKILPQIMTFYHEYAMQQWLNDSTKLYMNNQSNSYFKKVHRGFIKQKNGFVIPIHYKINYNIFQEKFYVYITNQKEFNENFQFKIFIITDNKGVIKEISSLGFAYFNFTKENLASKERFIDELGINFNNELFQQDGIFVNLEKKTAQKQSNLMLSLDKENLEESTLRRQEMDEFYVKGEKIWMPTQEEEEDGDYGNNHTMKNGKRDIGSIICLEKYNKDKPQQKDVKFQSLNFFGDEILNFYEMNQEEVNASDEEAPLAESRPKKSVLKSAVNELIQTEKQALKEKSFLKYGQKIKTYRLVDKQLKRVVEEYSNQDSQYDEFNEQNIDLSLFQIQKLKNPLFIEKIKNAINTNIDHFQVRNLKAIFTVFLVCLITLSVVNYVMVNKQLEQLSSYADTNMQWVNDLYYVNYLIHLSFNSSDYQNLTEIYANYTSVAEDYTISFNPDITVAMTNYNDEISMVSLQSALIWTQGYILNYFNNNSLIFNDTQLLFYNYYTSIYPAIQSFDMPVTSTQKPTIIIFIILLCVSLAVVVVWTYYIMIIDKKCSDIILWFLDIPIPYVTYLQTNCNTYIKTQTPVKELIQKGINFHDKNLYLEEYKSLQQDDQFNEENKSRKIMIARYKKKTLLSRCNCYYLSTIWLLIYSCISSSSYLIALSSEITFFKFMNSQWVMTTRQLIWSSTIPNNLRLLIEKDVKKIGNISIEDFQVQLQAHFLNPVSTKGLAKYYEMLIAYGTEISTFYDLCFQGDVCEDERYSDEQANRCKSFLNARLQGGIQSIFTYYATLQRSRYVQIQHVQYDYVNIFLLEIFDLWKKTIDKSIARMIDTITIILVLYLMVSVVGYFLIWLLYLKKLNVKLNQTIQMLNMIPIKMLPKSRKDIRDFFSWIIREANKYKNSNEN